MMLEVVRKNLATGEQEVVDRIDLGSEHFINAPIITIQTATGPNEYRIQTDRTELILGILGGVLSCIVRVHAE
jgi:hypothetical protein